jgi:hypothetical protein
MYGPRALRRANGLKRPERFDLDQYSEQRRIVVNRSRNPISPFPGVSPGSGALPAV